MKRTSLSFLIAGLFVAPALAQERMEWSGSASFGIRYTDTNAKDDSKLNEYRDLGDGGAGIFGFELRGRSNENYLNGYGENIGRDDQYLDLNGGRYGSYRYRLYSDSLRHNFGSGPGAISPYNGIGNSTITATFPSLNTATWGSFDHSYKRKDVGGMFELQKTSPWYIRADVNEVRRQGINVFAGAQGTSPGNGFVDLPSPIEYKTRNYGIEVGHSTRTTHFAVNLSHSTFENDFDQLRWTNGFFANGLDRTMLPPDNELTRLAVNGNIRQLPLDSTLAGRFTYSKLTSDVEMPLTQLSTGGATPATNPSDGTFKGDVTKMTIGLALNSHPTQAASTKLYADYIKEENHSTEMSFSPAPGSGLTGGTGGAVNCSSTGALPCTPERFEYEKKQLGLEAGYRFGRPHKLSGGLEWTAIDRERADFQKTDENRLFAEYKNSSLDSLTARIKYQFLARRSDFNPHTEVLLANPMDLYVRRFDAANVDQNLVKLVLDFTPRPLLDFGFEAIFKKNDYKETILGRTNDDRQEYYVNAGYGDPKALRAFVFGDVEYVQFESDHRVGTGNPDPATPPTTTTYNWSAKNKDNAWQVGLGVDWTPITRLTFKFSALYAETDGMTEFTIQPGGAPGPFTNIPTVDDTKRTSVTLRAVWAVDRQWELTGGYSYEKYRYSDISYDNTRYVAGTGASASYTTGQFAFQNYEANILFAIAKYKF